MKRGMNGLTPTIDSGRVVKLFFNAIVEGDNGARVAAPLTLDGPFPALDQLSKSGEPTQAQIRAAAQQLAEDMGLYARLEQQVREFEPPAPNSSAPAVAQMPLSDDETKAAWVNDVDTTIGDIITRFTRFQLGYEQREQAAKAYKAAGYAGDVSIWISGFADNAKLGYRDAADRILAQAAALRAAVVQLDGTQRMRKYSILGAATIGEARKIYADIIQTVRGIEASLP